MGVHNNAPAREWVRTISSSTEPDQLALSILDNLLECFRYWSTVTIASSEENDHMLLMSTKVPIPDFNYVVMKDPFGAPSDEMYQHIASFFSRWKMPYHIMAWRWGDRQNLAEAYRDHGYRPYGEMPGMRLDIPGREDDSSRPRGIAMHRVESDKEVEQYAEAVRKGFGVPDTMGDDLRRAVSLGQGSNPKIDLLLVKRDESPIATSLLFRGSDTAGIYLVSTVPEERGKGIGRWLTQETAKMALDEGYSTAVIQASSMGLPVYRRIGFVQNCVFDVYTNYSGEDRDGY